MLLNFSLEHLCRNELLAVVITEISIWDRSTNLIFARRNVNVCTVICLQNVFRVRRGILGCLNKGSECFHLLSIIKTSFCCCRSQRISSISILSTSAHIFMAFDMTQCFMMFNWSYKSLSMFSWMFTIGNLIREKSKVFQFVIWLDWDSPQGFSFHRCSAFSHLLEYDIQD